MTVKTDAASLRKALAEARQRRRSAFFYVDSGYRLELDCRDWHPSYNYYSITRCWDAMEICFGDFSEPGDWERFRRRNQTVWRTREWYDANVVVPHRLLGMAYAEIKVWRQRLDIYQNKEKDDEQN